MEHDEQSKQASHPNYLLHSTNAVAWAAFWGTPIAAGIVLAINYWRTGQYSAARYAVVLGVILFAGVSGVLYFVPDELFGRLPLSVIILPQLLLVRFVAVRLQQQLLNEHVSHQGHIGSDWRAVGIGILCGGVLLFGILLAFGVESFFQPSPGVLVKSGNFRIYCGANATKQDVQKLASTLEAIGYPQSDLPLAHIKADGSAITISFFLNIESDFVEPDVVELFREVGSQLVLRGFSPPLTLQICDESFAVKKVLTID